MVRFSKTKKSLLEEIATIGTYGILASAIFLCIYFIDKTANKSKEQQYSPIQIERFEDKNNIKGYDTIIINNETYQIIRKDNNYQLIKQ